MYLRTFKQFLRSLQPPFDERQYGLSSTYDLVRQAQKEGLLRVERNRQGILRIFPADRYPQPVPELPAEESVPAAAAHPEFKIPSPELEIPLPEPESEAAMQAELPVVLEETAFEPAEPETEPAPVPEISPEQGRLQAKKQRARRPTKASSSASPKRGKSEKRKLKPVKEKPKD
jgi:hypothetical protein